MWAHAGEQLLLGTNTPDIFLKRALFRGCEVTRGPRLLLTFGR